MNLCSVDMILSKGYSNNTPPREKMSRMHNICESKKRFFFPNTHTKEYAMSQTLLEMAKDLVMAQIAAHRLAPDEMHAALQHTYATLQALKAQEESHGSVAVAPPDIALKPVHWRKSITKHAVTCLECGASFKQLSMRHLKAHGLDGRSYRIKYGIPRTQPLAAKATTSRRKEMVQRSKPWEKAPTFVKAQEKAQRIVAQKTGRTQRKKTARRKA
jgi:predicted transcriptional regulator